MNRRILMITIGVLALLTIFSTAVLAAEPVLLDSVDFGSAGTEDGHNLVGWGRSATDQTGGIYGGIGDGGCRLVWDGDDDGPDAQFSLSTSGGTAESLELVHLDGMTDDGFDVEVKYGEGTWLPVESYADQDADEIWETFTIDLSSLALEGVVDLVFRITATGEKWGGFPTWGQLCIDKAELYGSEEPEEPEPGEFCEIQFRPPANLKNHPVNVNATLPIKFWMADCYNNPLRGGEAPNLVVQYGGEENGDGDGSGAEPDWDEGRPLGLKRGTGGYQFIALFRPDEPGLYRAVVTYGEDGSWEQEFTVVEHGKGADKPGKEEKLTGKDKVKPGKPETSPQNNKNKDKPRGKSKDGNPGRGRGPKKP